MYMSKPFKHYSVEDYLDVLSQKTPAPGGGSAAALAAGLGAALLSMAARYSMGKVSASDEKKIQRVLKESEQLRQRFVELVDLDAEAYLGVVRARDASPREREKALRQARAVPLEVAKLCYKGVCLAPVLALRGNKYLISDVEVAVEMLMAAFYSAMINVRINQG